MRSDILTDVWLHSLTEPLDGSKAVVPTNTMITLSGNMIYVDPSSSLTLQGTINNMGEIDHVTTLLVDAAGSSSAVTLQGKGKVSLSNSNFLGLITGEGFDAPVVKLVNVNNDIFGAGTIGGGNKALANQAGGVIAAKATTPLIINTGPSAVTNAGSLNADEGAELYIGSSLVNTGTLNSFGSTIIAAGNVTGTGRAIINSNGIVEFGAASTNGTRFAAGSTGQLILDDSKHYTGTISGFGANTTQSIDLTDINFATVTKSYAPASPNTSGTLTVKDTAGDVAHLKFSGTYTLASFKLSDDGHGGTVIKDPPVQTSPQTPQNNLASLFGQFMASWTNPSAALTGQLFSALATDLPTAISLPHPHG